MQKETYLRHIENTFYILKKSRQTCKNVNICLLFLYNKKRTIQKVRIVPVWCGRAGICPFLGRVSLATFFVILICTFSFLLARVNLQEFARSRDYLLHNKNRMPRWTSYFCGAVDRNCAFSGAPRQTIINRLFCL